MENTTRTPRKTAAKRKARQSTKATLLRGQESILKFVPVATNTGEKTKHYQKRGELTIRDKKRAERQDAAVLQREADNTAYRQMFQERQEAQDVWKEQVVLPTIQKQKAYFSGGGEVSKEYFPFDPITDPQAGLGNATVSTGIKYSNDEQYQLIKDPSFAKFADHAYASQKGVSIRKNPVDGQYEMFVAGTRDTGDWIANAIETPYYGITPGKKAIRENLPNPFRYRVNYVNDLDELALKYNVKRVYGHSRAAGLISEMENDTFGEDHYTKIGLDGAMILAHDKDMLNFTTAGDWKNPASSIFDGVLAFGGEQNVSVDATRIHQAW